jgi:type IX secretion system PorP/SprF family membrane protein
MKKLYVTIFFNICISLVFAQQGAQYSLYMLNPYGVNPAAAGLENTLIATGGFRSQWGGIEGKPVTQYLNVVLPLSIVSSGVGISIHNESIGARNGLSAKASYNYMVKMGNGLLSFGAAGGILQGALDGTKLRTPSGSYEPGAAIDHKDKLLTTVSLNGTVPTFDAGVYFKSEKFEMGLSASNIAANGTEKLKRIVKTQLFCNNTDPLQRFKQYRFVPLSIGKIGCRSDTSRFFNFFAVQR